MPKNLLYIFFFLGIAWPASAQFSFIENAQQRGIDFVQCNGPKEKTYIVEAKGAGVAAVDVNHDGWDDIYLVNGAYLKGHENEPKPRNQLYLNQGDGTFRDATDESGLGDTGFGTGAYFADVDNDGDLDCYLTNYGPNQLYKNDGKGHFSVVPNAGGAQNEGWSTGAAFADINGDGFLDLYVGQYAEFSTEIADKKGTFAPYYGHKAFIGPSSYEPAADNLFINNGDGTFRDETVPRGINSFAKGRAFTVMFSDLDNDNDLDIYIANDTTSNHLNQNDGKGNFEEIALLSGVALSNAGQEQGGMGVAIADTDGDLDFDITVANYHKEYNVLYRNDGNMQFFDAAFVTGFGQGSSPKVSFGLLLEDFDNDTWPDAYIAAGHVYPLADKLDFLDGYAQKNMILRNQAGHFTDVTDASGPAGQLMGVSRGCACADFDQDGDLDIIVNNLDGVPFFLENQSNGGNWIQISVQDERGMPAYGTRLELDVTARKQIAELRSSASFLSQNSAVLHFGLGHAEQVDRIRVRWPNGREKELKSVKANQKIVIRKDS